PAHRLHLLGRPGNQHHAVGLDALVLASGEFALGRTALIDQATTERIPGRAALAIAVFDQTALAHEDFGRQLPAVLTRHRPLHALDDSRDRAAVVLELLGAVLDGYASSFADVLVIGALVGVLEPAP